VKGRRLNSAIFYLVVFLLLANTCYAQEKPAPKEEKKTEPPPSSLPYEYTSENRIDPFLPFRTGVKGFAPTTSLSKPEIEIESKSTPVFALAELRFTGVLRKGNDVWAVLTTPEGRGIIVKKGMTLGKERAIVSDIIFEDKKTQSGIREIRKLILKVPVSRGEDLEDYDEVEIIMESMKPKEPES